MIELQNISFAVDSDSKEKEILRDVSLSIGDGKLVVITGPNGGGKSTLARMIAGVEKPSSGRILFNGEDITNLSITERAKKGIGFAFQQPVRFKGIQVLDLLRIAAGKPLSVGDACNYLAQVGLCARDYIGREVNASLSGGELKRIEIATVLAKASSLFEGMRRNIQGSSILIISHQERILSIADEIVVLKDGRVTASGPREEILPTLIGTQAAVRECRKNVVKKDEVGVC